MRTKRERDKAGGSRAGIPLAADLDIANVARAAVLGGRVEQGDAVEAGEGETRVDSELLERGEVEGRRASGRGQGEGGGQLHGDGKRGVVGLRVRNNCSSSVISTRGREGYLIPARRGVSVEEKTTLPSACPPSPPVTMPCLMPCPGTRRGFDAARPRRMRRRPSPPRRAKNLCSVRCQLVQPCHAGRKGCRRRQEPDGPGRRSQRRPPGSRAPKLSTLVTCRGETCWNLEPGRPPIFLAQQQGTGRGRSEKSPPRPVTWPLPLAH